MSCISCLPHDAPSLTDEDCHTAGFKIYLGKREEAYLRGVYILEAIMRYQAAIFDMDGTVLNTLTDLCNGINYALGQCGHRHDFTEKDAALFV